MPEKKRPTAVSVIGWAWIIFGGLAALVSGFVFIMLALIPEARMDLQVLQLQGACLIELALGVLGVIAGVAFLRLAPWSRPTLEALTWLLLALMVSMLIFLPFGTPMGTERLDLLVGASLFVALIYGTPLVLVLRGLRSDRVRSAMMRRPTA